MSRLWRERMLVSLTPALVAWVQVSRGLLGARPQAHAKQLVSVDDGGGEAAWHAPLATLRKQANAWHESAVDVSVVLSNQFVRYALIPATDGVGNEAEAAALARFHFSKIHGSRAQGWDVRMAPAPYGTPSLAAAIDNALLEELRACFPATGPVRLKSVQPWLMSAYNATRKSMPNEGAWLLLVEPDRVCAALLSGTQWQTVQNVRGRYDSAADCLHLLERERLRMDAVTVPQTVLVQSTAETAPTLCTADGWKSLPLQTQWPLGTLENRDALYSIALTAL